MRRNWMKQNLPDDLSPFETLGHMVVDRRIDVAVEHCRDEERAEERARELNDEFATKAWRKAAIRRDPDRLERLNGFLGRRLCSYCSDRPPEVLLRFYRLVQDEDGPGYVETRSGLCPDCACLFMSLLHEGSPEVQQGRARFKADMERRLAKIREDAAPFYEAFRERAQALRRQVEARGTSPAGQGPDREDPACEPAGPSREDVARHRSDPPGR